jgi:hypothetical protein
MTMRTIFFLLLIANLALYGYARLDSGSTGEGARLTQQVQPAKIKLLTPQQVAALGPAKVAALADVCVEWGPFSDTDRTRVLAELEPSGLGRLLTQKRVDTNTAFWVFLPRSSNRTTIEKRVTDLKAAGIKDIAVVDTGPLRYTISLGVFRTEEAANNYVAELAKQDIGDARVGPRQQTIPQTALVIRDPDSAVVGRIRALLPGYPGTDIKTGSCEKAN